MSSIQQAMESIETLQHMGLEVLEEGPNHLLIKMPKEGNRNHLGGVYAGAIFTLAEFPFGMLFISRFGLSEIYPVVGEITIRYQAPASGPLFVEFNISDEEWDEIERVTKKEGKMKIVRNVEVKDELGNINTIVSATYFSILAKKM